LKTKESKEGIGRGLEIFVKFLVSCRRQHKQNAAPTTAFAKDTTVPKSSVEQTHRRKKFFLKTTTTITYW